MTLKEILETNPLLITSIGGTIIGLGGKDLLISMYNRYCKKADEKESDHQKLEDLAEKVDRIIEKLDAMEANDKLGMKNDLIILETDLAEMQNRAIVKGKVSSTCMPRYLKNYDLYIKLAEDTDGYDASEEVKLNHQRILKLVADGHVADDVKEWYK